MNEKNDAKDEWKNDGIANLHVKKLMSVNEYDMDNRISF
jgi:hypothetical protein